MIYVDPLMPYGGSKKFNHKWSCHMMADSVDELKMFAKEIGLKEEWIQFGSLTHYDLTQSKRAAAISHGAQEVSHREVHEMLKAKRAERPTP